MSSQRGADRVECSVDPSSEVSFMSCNVRNWLVCAAGTLLIAGCGSGSGAASSSLDKMTETQRNEVMQKTVQNTMDKNLDAMKQAGMNPEGGAGFQPPDSMKKYMN